MSKPSGALFSTNDPHSGAFIVYINGLEVPCKSVSHRYGVWQVPEMVLEMVADPVLTRLGAEDRIQVQVFYLDDTKVDPSVAPQFRIFGEGEITGWGYQNTPSGRSIMLTCVNQVAIFTQLFVHFLTNLDDMMGHGTDKGAGVTGIAVASSDIVFPFSLFSEGIIPGESPETATRSAITRPFDFLYNVVKNMIGAQVPRENLAVPATNFFTRWARLTNFHNRFAAMPFFDEVVSGNIFPVLQALQNTSAVDVISKNLIPQVQNAGSLWDMLQLVYQTVFMEVTMIPTMPLVSVDLRSGHIQQTNFEKHRLTLVDGRYVPAIAPDPLKPHRIPNYFAKPQFLFGLPPSCNVIFPSQIKLFAYDENFATQPTRLYFNDETINKILKLQGGHGETVMNSLATAYPPEADAANQARFLFPKFNGKNFLLFPEEFFKGPVMDRRNIPPWLFFLKQNEVVNSTTTSDGTIPTPPPPSQTGAATVTATPAIPANAMRTRARVGTVGADGKRVFANNVEGLRSDITRLTMGNSIPVDFALAWIQHESDGTLKTTTHLNERGYFQIMGPHEKGDGTIVKFRDTEAAAIGLTEAHTGSSADSPLPGEEPPLLSTNHEESLAAGIALILYYRKQADRLAGKHSLEWSEGDMWRLTKLFHGGFGYATSFVEKAVAANVANDWTNAFNTVNPTLGGPFKAVVENATGVGGVLPTASGTSLDGNNKVIKQATAVPPPATPTDVTSSTSGTPSTGAAAGTPSQADLFEQSREGQQTVYQLYAKYEFFRERYSRRTGSAVLAFNPYVVPGFPAAIFDRRDTRVDVFCYITTVQQKMSHRGGHETTVSFVYGRTIQEMFDLMKLEFSQGSAAAGTGPREPIRDIRKVVQSFSAAETLYQRMFYGNQVLFGKDASFDYRKIIGYQPVVASDMPERIVIEGPDEASQDAAERAKSAIATLEGSKQSLQQQIAVYSQAQRDAQITLRELRNAPAILGAAQENARVHAQEQFDVATHGINIAKKQLASIDTSINYQMSVLVSSNEVNEQTRVVHNLAGDREIVPLPSAEGAFQDYDVAMRYNWRPICTLDEYILFYDSVGEGPVPASNHPRSAGAMYYDRIRRMTPVTPDFQFPPGADGLSSAVVSATPEQVAAGEAPARAASVPGLKSGTGPHGTNAPGDFPQVRDDWDKILLAYRNNVYHVKAPRT